MLEQIAEGFRFWLIFGIPMECKVNAIVLSPPKTSEKTMNQCLMPQPIHASGIEILRGAGLEPLIGEEACRLADPDRVVAGIFRSSRFGRPEMERFKNLRVIGVHGAGFDNIDLTAAQHFNIPVFNTPGRNARSVAEHAIA